MCGIGLAAFSTPASVSLWDSFLNWFPFSFSSMCFSFSILPSLAAMAVVVDGCVVPTARLGGLVVVGVVECDG